MSLVHFIESTLNKYHQEEVVFFGGSFNPWHSGHTSCVQLAPKDIPLVVMPDNNPFKVENRGRRFTSVQDIRAEVKTYRKDAYFYLDFLLNTEPTPTWEWVQTVKSHFPTLKISILLGNDSFIGITGWNDHALLLNSLEGIYIVSRQDDLKRNEEQIQLIQSIAPEIKLHFLGNHPFEHLSSTEIRKKM